MNINCGYMSRATISVSYYVRRQASKKTGLYPVLMRIAFGGERITIGQVGLFLDSPDDLKLNRIVMSCPKERDGNDFLQREAYAVEAIAEDLFANADFSLARVKERYLMSKRRFTPMTILEVYKERLEVAEEEYKAHKLTKPSIERWRRCMGVFTKFLQEEYKRTDLSINALNVSLFNKYSSYLADKRGLHTNTAERYLTFIKAVSTHAADKGYIHKSLLKDCKVTKVPSNVQPITIEEFSKIAGATFVDQQLELTKDLFLFSCYTGLAYSDVKSLRQKDIRSLSGGGEIIIKNRVKTRVEADIPLIDLAKEIINKYAKGREKEEYLLPVATNNRLNLDLKTIMKKLGIETHLTFHVARHSFATFSLDTGVTAEGISKMLGHSNITTTSLYAKVTHRKIHTEMKVYSAVMQELVSKAREQQTIYQ